jgi:hypothetical protein
MFFPKITTITVLGLAIFMEARLHAIPPTGNIPNMKEPVNIDGIMSPGEWADAAVLRKIFDKGNHTPSKPGTDFYLKYGNDALYVCAVCHEHEAGYPEAYSRNWNDLLFRNDDAVQVVLGIRDINVMVRDKIDVGGYEGALNGEKAKADFYYQYTVNAVGSVQRMFNEAPVEDRLFEAATRTTPGKYWIVEMKIPFSSCGLKNVSGQVISANLFRFRPPVMTGWFYPNFGGYFPMPFGNFKFLPQGRENAKTNEDNPKSPTAAPVQKFCIAEIQYGPLSGAVIGNVKISGYEKELYGILTVSGEPEIKEKLTETVNVDHDAQEIAGTQLIANIICKIKPGNQPAREIEFTVVDKQGAVITKTSKKCEAVKAPEWLGTENGIEYVSEKFPMPWTSPVISGKSAELVDKTVGFNYFGLPQSVLFKDGRGELLAGQPEIEIKRKGRKINFSGADFKCLKDKVVVEVGAELKNGNAILETKTRMEPDGFMVVKFRVKGLPVKEIDSVALKIPLKRESAKFIMHGTLVQNIGQLTGAGYRDIAAPLWVGTYDKGLSFNFDNKLFLAKNLRHQIEIVESEDITWLVFNFVDGCNQLQEDMIFRFFLQPTPTKPLPEKRIMAQVKMKWEKWSEWHGFPDLRKIPELAKWTKQLKQEEKLGILYCCQGLQQNAPYFDEFRSDMELQPRWRYYRTSNTDCFATCKRGPEGDLQLWGWGKLIKDAGVRGFVSDGLTQPWGDSNPAHSNGCGQKQKIEWDSNLQSRVVAQRDFIKRMRGLLSDTKEPFCVVAHTGGGININVLSFIDGYMEGEQTLRYNRGYFLPLPIYAAGFNGAPWGWRSIFWAKQWRNYQGIESSLAYALLFNTELLGNTNVENPDYILELYKDFQTKNTGFYPFWAGNKYVKFSSDNSLCSLYLAENKAMIVVSNLRYNPDTYKLDISKLFPGKNLRLKELLSGRELQHQKIIDGKLEPHSCDVIAVSIDEPSSEILKREEFRGVGENWNTNAGTNGVVKDYPVTFDNIEKYQESDWRVNTEADGVKADRHFKLPDGREGMSFGSLAGKIAATAKFDKLFGDNAYIDMTVKLPERFKLKIGPVLISYGGGGWVRYGWFVTGNMQKRGNGRVFCQIPVKTDKFVNMKISIKNKVLNVMYDNMVVVQDLPMEMPAAGNVFYIETWWNDKVEFTVNAISSTPKDIILATVKHPILDNEQ